MLLVRRYVADKADADELLDCLKPYEDFTTAGAGAGFCRSAQADQQSAMPQTDDHGAVSCWTA